MCSLDGFDHRKKLVVRQSFARILVMTVLIIKPVSLELIKIRASHNSETNVALKPIKHQTAIHVISDAAFVGMGAPELPESFVSWK